MKVITWYVHDSADEAWVFPQALSRSGTSDARAIYLHCAYVCLASAWKQGERDLVFYTNLSALPEPVASALKDLGVVVRTLPCRTRGPVRSGGAWGNQFYVFDIIRDLVTLDTEPFLILDSDCIVRAPLADVWRDLERYGALTLSLTDKRNHVMNGWSSTDLERLYEKIFGTPAREALHYKGGEFAGMTLATARDLMSVFDEIYKKVFSEFATRASGEEAHFLTIIYERLNISSGTANRHLKRCWTTFRYNNITAEDADSSLSILHLPAEKRTGFALAFATRSYWLNLSGEEFRHWVALCFGIPRRSMKKYVRDFAILGSIKLKARLKGR